MTLQQLKPGLLAALILAFITSLPQIYLIYERGREWNGGYASFDTDEFAYSAYVNALINGRPRRNDPYTANDGGNFETLFSIQFVPAYSIALPARLFNLSAVSAFILLLPLISIASTLVLFVLLFEVTGNSWLSAGGALAILCFGAFAYTAPWVFFTPRVAFPFLRRYMPGFSFPFFLALALFAWRGLTRDSVIWPILAGLSLVLLIYSYFFLWTAAVVWLLVLLTLWMIGRPHERVRTVRCFAIISLIAGAGLIPYLSLLRARAPFIDGAVALEFTHRLDLLRGPEVYGGLIILILLKRRWRQPQILLTLSFALAPFVLFNQQVLTGRSLQPFHYEQFIANYWSVIGLFLAFTARWTLSPRSLRFVLLATVALGLSYGSLVSVGRLKMNAEADKGRPAALRLQGKGVVFAPDLYVTNSIPTNASNPVLWARHLFTFSNVDLTEQKRRFYQYLYYSDVNGAELKSLLAQAGGNAQVEILGAARANPVLSADSRSITPADIENAAAEYQTFCDSFSHDQAVNPMLSYAVLSPTQRVKNLDRWYERDGGEPAGAYIVYRLRLRQ